jgi:pyruvate/2-oxoglutarate dehydrogenase complex dihydrolipoamide acyltransferase (E2) component
MAYKIVMPQLGLTMEEGAVTGWLKKPGEYVEKGEVLFTVETDKVEMEVEAMASGYLGGISVEIGQKVTVGTQIAELTDKA